MNRRTAAAAASAVVLTVATGTVAVAANLGLLASEDATIGSLEPVAATTSEAAPATPVETETVYVDVTEQPGPPATTASGDGVAPAPPAAPAGPVGTSDDHEDDDHEDDDHEDAEHDEDEHEDDEHEDDEQDEDEHFEGRDDDD